MNSKRSTQNKLLLEFIQSQSSPEAIANTFSGETIEHLKGQNVQTVVVIASEPVDSDAYITMVKIFRSSGLQLHNCYIEGIDEDNLISLRNAAQDIAESLGKGGCLIVSYRTKLLYPVIASYYIHAGLSVQKAIDTVRAMGGEASAIDGYGDFLTRHQNALRQRIDSSERVRNAVKLEKGKASSSSPQVALNTGIIQPVPMGRLTDAHPAKITENGDADIAAAMKREADETPGIINETEERPPVAEKEKKKKKQKGTIEKHDDAAVITKDDTRTGLFFKSIRFKLVFIISIIIIFSLSGMIFLATYFFKKDNEIRIQESNLKISEVIALKIRSEIEKYQIVSSTILEGQGEKEKEQGAYFTDEKEIVFTGLMDNKSAGRQKFIKSFVNKTLMIKLLISADDLKRAHESGMKMFARSFKGETVISNISPLLDKPVFALTMPWRYDKNRQVAVILVSFIRLEELLKTFVPTGITRIIMVNNIGDVIAHPDASVIVSGGNLANLPICKKMMTSKLDNGQTRYVDDKGVSFLGSFKKIGIGGAGIIATVEERMALQEVYNIQRRNIYLMAIVLTGAILFVFFFGKTITTPIVRLVGATKKIIQGQYLVDIRPTSSDEIGQLTSTFIEMGRGLEEREKIKSAFGKFVNKDIAEAAMRDELRLGGERKEVAIFFSDIRSFTEMSESLQPEEVVDFLNKYMTRMVQCIEETSGIVDKFIGDAIMAVWGTPISKGNDTENAISSALLMRRALEELNLDRGGPGKPLIKIGCGVNTGTVLAGQIGSEDRMEYTVIGDAVNLASRIEALNKPFGTDILISQDSYRLVQNIFAVEKMKKIMVKGKKEPQQIYAVLGRIDDPGRPKNVDGLRRMLGTESISSDEGMEDEIFIDGEVKYEIIE